MKQLSLAELHQVHGGTSDETEVESEDQDNWDSEIMGDWNKLAGVGCSRGIDIMVAFANYLTGQQITNVTVNQVSSMLTGQTVPQHVGGVVRSFLNYLTNNGMYCGPQDPFAGGSPG